MDCGRSAAQPYSLSLFHPFHYLPSQRRRSWAMVIDGQNKSRGKGPKMGIDGYDTSFHHEGFNCACLIYLSLGWRDRYNLLVILGQFVSHFVSARISDVSGILIHR